MVVCRYQQPRATNQEQLMYAYNSVDNNFIAERVAHYREQTRRFLNGEVSDSEFLQLRLRNGLYLQRLAPMLRVAVPYGTLSSGQLRQLAKISRKWDRGYGHLSTRQNMQFNWPEVSEVPDILEALSEVDMHAIQTSGNCIRNVTSDEYAGAALDEEVDPRPYCEIIRQWSTNHPEFDWLPRKFKIAVTGAKSDRAAIGVHDIGLRVYRQDGEDIVVDVFVGGGQGRTPLIAEKIKSRLPLKHLLTYIEAILRVYNRYGRRDNKYKARIKILVKAMTAISFAEKVDSEWIKLKDSQSTITSEEIARVENQFAAKEYPIEKAKMSDIASNRAGNKQFDNWINTNTKSHKVDGYRIVTLSTKINGVPPGDVSDMQMDAVAKWADDFGLGEIRISHEQNFVLPDIRIKHLYELWERATEKQLASANLGMLSDMVCCPGGDYCSLANAKSIPIAEEIQNKFSDYDFQYDLGPLDINISGCMNACGHHHVGHIGILGVDKKGSEYYQISLGGHSGSNGIAPSIGKIIGPSFSREEIPSIIEGILNVFLANRQSTESFLACVRRIGLEPFKTNIYGKGSSSGKI